MTGDSGQTGERKAEGRDGGTPTDGELQEGRETQMDQVDETRREHEGLIEGINEIRCGGITE